MDDTTHPGPIFEQLDYSTSTRTGGVDNVGVGNLVSRGLNTNGISFVLHILFRRGVLEL